MSCRVFLSIGRIGGVELHDARLSDEPPKKTIRSLLMSVVLFIIFCTPVHRPAQAC